MQILSCYYSKNSCSQESHGFIHIAIKKKSKYKIKKHLLEPNRRSKRDEIEDYQKKKKCNCKIQQPGGRDIHEYIRFDSSWKNELDK